MYCEFQLDFFFFFFYCGGSYITYLADKLENSFIPRKIKVQSQESDCHLNLGADKLSRKELAGYITFYSCTLNEPRRWFEICLARLFIIC